MNGNSRKVTRSPVWPETQAIVTYADKMTMKTQHQLSVRGGLGNLGSSGMFLITDEKIPLNTRVDIVINFDPSSPATELSLSATGETVRIAREGVGIRFTNINLNQLQKCIISKLNRG